jgi:ankyrin repeat protein
MIKSKQADLNAALLNAIGRRDADTCEDLLRAGADPDGDADADGGVMLTHSIQYGDVVTTLCLLNHGAAPTAKSTDHQVPLVFVAQYSTPTQANMLLERGARVDEMTRRSTNSALNVACLGGKAHLCRTFIDAGADLAAANRRGMTPLHCAVRSMEEGPRAVALCRMLVDAGADINRIAPPPLPIAMPQYLTPFQDAVALGKLDNVIFFVEECGADLDQRTHAGQTLLEITKFLNVKTYLRSAMVERGIGRALDGGAQPAQLNTRSPQSCGPL